MSLPPVTFLVGPYTRAMLALNGAIRAGRAPLAAAGLGALPSRAASPIARALAMGEGPVTAREDAFAASMEQVGEGARPVLLSALNALGAPVQALSGRELFPEAGAFFAGLAATIHRSARIVVGIEPLPQFFATAGTGALAKRVSKTPWEVFYELSWAELLRDIAALCPETELLVVTPEACVCRPASVTATLFGEASGPVDPRGLRAAHLTPEGQAAAERFDEAGAEEGVLADILSRLGNGPAPDVLKARFGIDPLTATLLDQRFAEDVTEIAGIDGVRLL